MKVLVTGAGALLGQGIIRSLRDSSLRPTIVAVDPSPLSAGFYWADSAHLVPMANDPQYLEEMRKILNQEHPDLILIGTDVELLLFATNRHQIETEFKTRILVSHPEVISIANDKWLTYCFLKDNGFDHPKSCLPGQWEEFMETTRFPFVVKPRVGARSVGVSIVKNLKELRAAMTDSHQWIIQECVGDERMEYTAGVLYFEGQPAVSIVMRRELRDGNTYRAFVEEYPELNVQVRKLAEKLRPYGPSNFQFRFVDGHLKVFEINARFSGTTPLRMHAGFNEVEMTLRHLILKEPMTQPPIKPMVILRHWSETIVPPNKVLQSKTGQ